MASKSKSRPPRKKSSPNQLANLGLFDIPDVNMVDIDEDTSDVDESTLESELEALLRGETPIRRNKPKPKAPIDIEKLAEECLKDDFDDDDDDDGTLEEDLLKELQTLSPESTMEIEETQESKETDVSPLAKESLLTLLQDRLDLYKEAQKAAKSNNDISKARRYDRAIKSLEGLIKSAKSGAEINEADIPPIVSIPKPLSSAAATMPLSKPVLNVLETPDDTEITQSSENNAKISPIPAPDSNISSTVTLLTTRQNQYKTAALQAKKAGNKDLAIRYMRTAKTFDAVIEAAKNNEPVNLKDIPPPPDSVAKTAEIDSQKLEHEQVQNASAFEIAALAAANEDPQPEIFCAPPAPSTVLEALQQRLDKYTQTKQTAESEGNSGKARRLQRIIKSYETAIKDYKAGKSVQYDDLPTPPGFAPIPLEKELKTEIQPKKPTAKPVIPATETNVPNPPVRRPKVQRANTSTAEKQLEFLLERQKLFREAALAAKKEGSIQQAKEYLKMSKGFDSMIEACRCGLPIDASQIPTPPQLESDFVIINVSDCNENSSNLSQEELFQSLEKDLLNQLEICSKNKNHFLRLGDVSSASKFEKLALESKKDLSVIQFQKLKGDEVILPKFHYETRLFSIVMCNADLSDNDIEVIVKRGINLPGKADELDSYVRIDLPIPSEAPQRAKTHTVRDTNNPTYDEKFKFEINRKSRSQLRLFKRNSLKLEVWSKGGFLRSDSILGTAQVKLVGLESKCTIHESFNLMDGRKSVGGMLEVEVRIREPLLTKQVEEVQEKWLVIGS